MRKRVIMAVTFVSTAGVACKPSSLVDGSGSLIMTTDGYSLTQDPDYPMWGYMDQYADQFNVMKKPMQAYGESMSLADNIDATKQCLLEGDMVVDCEVQGLFLGNIGGGAWPNNEVVYKYESGFDKQSMVDEAMFKWTQVTGIVEFPA